VNRALAPGSVKGTIRAPPSKSYTHRALVAGFLTGSPYVVRSPLDSDDTLATARGLVALGGTHRASADQWRITGPASLAGSGSSAMVHCGRSGTTLRFLCSLAAARPGTTIFVGDAQLERRPMAGLFEALRQGGARIEPPRTGRSLPTKVTGPLRPITTALSTDISSQFLSSLLFTLPTLPGPSHLRFHGPIVSEPYVQATVAVLAAHGIRVDLQRAGARVRGDQVYQGSSFRVPGDASSAAYLWAAAAIGHGKVRIRNIPAGWPQADLAILNVLEEMGAEVQRHADGATVRDGPLQGIDVDLTSSPDLYPLVGVLGAFARGTTRVRGADHVVHKESDRRDATEQLVHGLGARVRRRTYGLEIEGTPSPQGLRITNVEDHRVVMSGAVAALGARSSSLIGDDRCVRKSFPDFWRVLARLGAGAAA
jgi:3-phosphoshikimate 1-carboxyvinyltransferase